MNWFFIAMIAPALYAVCNHIDKYLIEKVLSKDEDKKDDVGALILFSSLFAGLVLPFIYLVQPGLFDISIISKVALLVDGVLTVAAIIFYLYAMEQDEASIVVPFYQLIPVFGFILGLIILKESLSMFQITSSLAVIIAAVILSLDLTGEKIQIRKKVALYMIGASILYALAGIIFKKIAVDDGFWISAFWQLGGMFLSGIIIFAVIKNFRKNFLNLLLRSKGKILFFNFFSETLSLIAELIFMYAYLLAPIALVMVANVFQPFFVFLFGVILTIFFPKVATERLSRKHLVQKILAIAVMMIGAYFLYF